MTTAQGAVLGDAKAVPAPGIPATVEQRGQITVAAFRQNYITCRDESMSGCLYRAAVGRRAHVAGVLPSEAKGLIGSWDSIPAMPLKSSSAESTTRLTRPVLKAKARHELFGFVCKMGAPIEVSLE
jgi:hypothetical protein